MNEENSVIVIDQQEQHKKKGALAVILAIAFVAILGIGGTFAYLSYTTNQAMNRFTTVPGDVTADVIEPAWDNALTGSAYKASDGTTTIPKAAAEMGAGSSVAKNPFIVNTTKVGEGNVKGSDEYVAMKLVFEKWDSATAKYIDMTADEVTKLLAVYNFKGTKNTTGTNNFGINQNPSWTAFTYTDCGYESTDTTNKDAVNVKYFYYANKLTAMYRPTGGTSTVIDETINASSNTWGYTTGSDAASDTLFDTIIYDKDASNTAVSNLNTMLGTDNPGWRVTIKGAAIQAVDGVTVSTADVLKQFKSLLDATATSGASGWRTTANGGTGKVPVAA